MEAKSFPEEVTSDEYYAALRAYKQSDHQVSLDGMEDGLVMELI